MELPKVVFNALKTTKTLPAYACFWVLITVIEFIQQTMMAYLLIEQTLDISYRVVIAIIILSVRILRHGVFGNYLTMISGKVKISIWRDTLLEYNALTL